jgi:hypothetical protein
MTEYRPESWVDPRVERRKSAIEGFGTFARAPIRAGEVVFIFGGDLVTDADVAAGRVIDHSYLNVAEGLYLGHRVDAGISLDDYLNHSCAPNIWMQDEVTVAAMRDIAPGEELVIDYVMYLPSGWVAPWPCRCGTSACRGTVSGDDWVLPELQERYRGHFSPFVERKIVAWQLQNVAK